MQAERNIERWPKVQAKDCANILNALDLSVLSRLASSFGTSQLWP